MTLPNSTSDRSAPHPKQPEPAPRKKSEGVGETIRTILYAVLIALTVRTFAYEPFNIPSGSMIPTLLIGDYLFVSKFSYGYSKYTFPFIHPPFDGRLLGGHPERGDVVVFKLPRDNQTDYIKRIIGLPGDRIQVRGGTLYVNGDPVTLRRVENYVTTNSLGRTVRIPQFEETLPGGRTHRILDAIPDGDYDNTRVFTVPADHYFVMGDNRDNSSDSRAPNGGVGFVPAENLVGRAEFLFFSLDSGSRFWEIWKWPWAIRFNRLFQAVE